MSEDIVIPADSADDLKAIINAAIYASQSRWTDCYQTVSGLAMHSRDCIKERAKRLAEILEI